MDDVEVEGSGRGTCLPIMPMQAIDGVVMLGTKEQERVVRRMLYQALAVRPGSLFGVA